MSDKLQLVATSSLLVRVNDKLKLIGRAYPLGNFPNPHEKKPAFGRTGIQILREIVRHSRCRCRSRIHGQAALV